MSEQTNEGISGTGFRDFLFEREHPRLSGIRGLNAYEYAEAARDDDFTGGLIRGWTPLYFAPFAGVTSDGVVQPGLFPLDTISDDERAPVIAMTLAAERLLDVAGHELGEKLRYAVDAVEWQGWANPEFMQHDLGLRLEFMSDEIRQAAMDLVAASLSIPGAAFVETLMKLNGFLGEVVELPTILNEFSYNFALYGEPSLTDPWGWQLYGHHLAVNCVVVEGHMVSTPVFFGAEPDGLDTETGFTDPVFATRIDHLRALMAALPDELQEKATIYASMVDPEMPPGRVHPGDERHLAGAFQDNRVIPYEGIRVTEMSEPAREAVKAVIDDFIAYLPDGPRRRRRREILSHLDETYFCWIGASGIEDVFYARLQSPVLVAELDHHCGVFLSNDEPAPFHIHTVLRTPNGNDYARALVAQWQARSDE